MKNIFVFLGPSGAGKTKIAMKLRSYGIPELISHTDRAIRVNDGEKEGVNYYYVSSQEFKTIELIEYSNYSGNHYGLSVKEVEDKLKIYDVVYAITDINGIVQLKKVYGDMVTVIYVSINPETARARMVERRDMPSIIEQRMKNSYANDEFSNAKFADEVIDNNGSLENSQKQLIEIVESKLGRRLELAPLE